jgi:hypothetical protein
MGSDWVELARGDRLASTEDDDAIPTAVTTGGVRPRQRLIKPFILLPCAADFSSVSLPHLESSAGSLSPATAGGNKARGSFLLVLS